MPAVATPVAGHSRTRVHVGGEGATAACCVAESLASYCPYITPDELFSTSSLLAQARLHTGCKRLLFWLGLAAQTSHVSW